MPAVGISGAAFTVDVGSVGYEDQVVSGTISTTPTITRTRTLSSEAYDLTDIVHTATIEFLYDENTGLYDALSTAAVAGTSVAVDVRSTTGHWASSVMHVESLEVNYDATGVATATVNFVGQFTFS